MLGVPAPASRAPCGVAWQSDRLRSSAGPASAAPTSDGVRRKFLKWASAAGCSARPAKIFFTHAVGSRRVLRQLNRQPRAPCSARTTASTCRSDSPPRSSPNPLLSRRRLTRCLRHRSITAHSRSRSPTTRRPAIRRSNCPRRDASRLWPLVPNARKDARHQETSPRGLFSY